MSKTKKIVALVVAIVAAITFTILAFTSRSIKLEYTLLEDGTYAVSEYYNIAITPAAAKISDEYKGQPVTQIANNAFSSGTVKEVNIPSTVTYIGESAFKNCENLTSIMLPDSIESVGMNAFMDCGSLSVVLGKNIDFIGMNAFGYAYRVGLNHKNVAIPDFTIVGYTGTEAEAYANENGFKFVDITSPDAEIPQGSFDYSVFKFGDVNLDGQMSVKDATLIQKYLVGKAELNDVQESNAIIYSYNPSITIENATYIQKSLVGLDAL